MSRVGKLPVVIPQGVDVAINGETVSVKGTGGQMSLVLNSLVKIENKDGALSLIPVDESREANAMSGTMRQLVNNMVVGVSKGFEKKLSLQGVGFKATAQGNKLNLVVGFSHPVNKEMPAGRQAVGQVAAEIRAVRPPEPYKGKGIRYVDERVIIKETKKK